MKRRTAQLSLALDKKPRRRRRVRGRRVPLGRPVTAARVGFMPHEARAVHDRNHPVHVTMRRVELGPSFRAQRVHAAICAVLAAAKKKGVRVVHYSVQTNHLHLLVEGSSAANLSNQMRVLFSRIAFMVNAVAGRRGRLFRDRHHRHALKTPREVRNALVYILFNDRKHGATQASALALDPCSSAPWFADWSRSDRPPAELLLLSSGTPPPTSSAETWLARWGWHRGDPSRLLRFSEMPRPQGPAPTRSPARR